ncbi:MAG: TlpA disulfide reductase family protein [Burkholderiales bacterium]|nr:TlpA disulfide reductase family protein [Burkholderiales bacterium]
MRALLAALALAGAGAASGAELRVWNEVQPPPFALEDLEGRTHRLADYRGRVVLVNFWATWCAPCRDEMPSIERLRAALAGRPFAVLAVNLAEPPSRIRKFLATMPLGFPVLLDRDTAVAKAWRARILPASYLVGRDGVVRRVHYGELDWSGEAARRAVEALLE